MSIYVKGIFPEDGNPLSLDIDNFIQTIRYVTCIGVKIPSQGDSKCAMTFFKEESDNTDESEPGQPPGGGEDRYRE